MPTPETTVYVALMALCVVAMGLVAGWAVAGLLMCACAAVYSLTFMFTLKP